MVNKIVKVVKKAERGLVKAGDKTLSKVEKSLTMPKAKKKSKLSTRRILRKSQSTLTIENKKAAEYVPIYFQAELISTKKNMFLD